MVLRLIVCLISIGLLTGCSKKKVTGVEGTNYRIALLDLNDYGHCEQGYKRCLVSIERGLAEQEDPLLYGLKGTCLFKLGNLAEAESSFVQALALCTNPTMKAELQNNYACLLAACKRYDAAASLWQHLETSKDYLTPEVAFVNKGKMLAQQGNNVAALDCFKRAIDKAPQFVDAHYYLALGCRQVGEGEKARKAAQEVLALAPEHQGALRLLKNL